MLQKYELILIYPNFWLEILRNHSPWILNHNYPCSHVCINILQIAFFLLTEGNNTFIIIWLLSATYDDRCWNLGIPTTYRIYRGHLLKLPCLHNCGVCRFILLAKIRQVFESSKLFAGNLSCGILCQYVKERLRRMQSHAYMGYAEAMVFFEALPQRTLLI